MRNLTPDSIKRDDFIKETKQKLKGHQLSNACSGKSCNECENLKARIQEAQEFIFYD